MPVSRLQVVRNGIAGGCPNCGRRDLFQTGSLFRVNARCPQCGLRIEKGDGAFLGPLVINYAVTAFALIIPVILLFAAGVLGARATVVISVTAGLAAPLLLYRLSWSWWLMLYYFFLPDNLPANLAGRAEDDE